MSYLFDTDVISNTLKPRPSEPLLHRLTITPPEELFTSSITVGELLYGALRSGRAQELTHRLAERVWQSYGIIAFDLWAADRRKVESAYTINLPNSLGKSVG